MVRSAIAALVVALGACASGHAKTFRWSSAADIPTWDIHSQNNPLGNGMQAAVYEPLFGFDRRFQIEPVLATGYQQIGPAQLRVTLRRGVKFHDGADFDADDAVFSLHRALDKASSFGIYTNGIERVAKVDAHTIDIFTRGPDPVLLRELTELRMMDKGWAERNNSQAPRNSRAGDENFAHRNANGTGPFMLQSWEPDARLVLVANPNWWGTAAGRPRGNVTEVVYRPLRSDAGRVEALLAGELDLVLDPPMEELPRLRASPDVKVLDGIENRTIFLGMDQRRDELPGSDIKGRNPLKDVRVRQALYQAIDIDSLVRTTMHGLARPTGALIAPQVNGWTREADRRWPYDPAAARRLLAEAGYPRGFEVDFACPNNRYMNDEQVCRAVAAMWSGIGVRAKLRTLPLATYFPMLQRFEASIYLLGWGVPTFDALYALRALVRSVGAQGDGSYNVGRYSNPQMDALVERIKKETDTTTRNELIEQALLLSHRDVSHIPLYDQVVPWAMRRNVEVRYRADNRVDMRLVEVR